MMIHCELPSKIGNKARMSAHNTFAQYHARDPDKCNKADKETKDMWMGREYYEFLHRKF